MFEQTVAGAGVSDCCTAVSAVSALTHPLRRGSGAAGQCRVPAYKNTNEGSGPKAASFCLSLALAVPGKRRKPPKPVDEFMQG